MMYAEERGQVAYFMRRLYRQGLTTTSGGNISCRVGDGCVAISASKLDKGELAATGVGVVELAGGANLTPELGLSIETGMHLAIYRQRPDVQAIVHAHPVTAGAFCAIRGVELDTTLTAEAYALLGRPVFIPYALMGTEELATRVATGIGAAVCLLLENHGVLAVGDTLLAAFDRLELLEVAARHTLIVRQLGGVSPLDAAKLRELDHFVGRAQS
ncbi:MAG: class II aldolase/adducin family protein [Lentisphaerae bacterium]|jgi:L-fuculose-phosphate aldolase|nr:class II aldolase/adducin family protein [Lentisphaerota bacterium]